MDFKTFQINLMPSIALGYNDSDDFVNPNEIGSSSIPYGPRKLVINATNNLVLEPKIETLAGQIHHYSLQKPEVLYYLTKNINKALGYNEIEINNNRFIELDNNKYKWFKVKAEKKDLLEILPRKYLRKHSDIYTSFYTIEIKTTDKPKKQWADLAPYHIMQLNTHLGMDNQQFGFLWKIDLGYVKSRSKEWSYIWNNYMLLYPVQFNQKLYEFTINKAKQHFNYIINNTPLNEIPCPEFPEFECNNDCRKYCPNPIDKVKVKVNETCEHCKQEIRADTQLLIRNDKSYHYTDGKNEQYTSCVEACKNSYKINEVK